MNTLILLALMVQLAVSLPVTQRSATDEAETRRRSVRKLGNDTSTTPQQYMRDLYEDYIVRSDHFEQELDKPTDVWCFPDKGGAHAQMHIVYDNIIKFQVWCLEMQSGFNMVLYIYL